MSEKTAIPNVFWPVLSAMCRYWQMLDMGMNSIRSWPAKVSKLEAVPQAVLAGLLDAVFCVC